MTFGTGIFLGGSGRRPCYGHPTASLHSRIGEKWPGEEKKRPHAYGKSCRDFYGNGVNLENAGKWTSIGTAALAL